MVLATEPAGVKAQAATPPAPRYTVKELAPYGSDSSTTAHGINASGAAIGESLGITSNGAGTSRAVVWHAGVPTPLGILQGANVQRAVAINVIGQIAGDAELGSLPSVQRHAVRWTNEVPVDLAAPGAFANRLSFATALNAGGQVVGDTTADSGALWSGAETIILGKLPDLAGLPQNLGRANGINDVGQIAGTVFFGGFPRAVQWNASTPRAQPILLGSIAVNDNTTAVAINNSGTIVGANQDSINTQLVTPVVWRNTIPTPLSALPGSFANAVLAINDNDQIVGRSQSRDPATGFTNDTATLWQGNQVLDLNTLISPDSGWVLQEATGINQTGEIVGNGVHNGQPRGFLLTPVVLLGQGSSVTSAPPSVPADGTTLSVITVRLQDSTGVALPGRTISITSNRGGTDTIAQPTTPTNSSGQATGTIHSLQPGPVTITALDVTDGVAVPGSASVTFVTPSTRRAVIYIGGLTSGSDCTGAAHQLASEAPAWLHPYLQAHAGVTDPAYYFSYASGWCQQGASGVGENGDKALYASSNTCTSFDTEFRYLRDLIRRITDKASGMKVTLIGHSQGGLLATYTVGALQAGPAGVQDQDFVRSRIASVVTFDSFPHGFPFGLSLFPEYLKVAGFSQTCGFPPLAYPANYDAWPDTSPYAQLARQAGDVFNGYRMKIYTLAGSLTGISRLDFSIGGPAEVLTTVDGQTGRTSKDTVHYRIPTTSHATIWDPTWLNGTALAPAEPLIQQPAEQVATCAVLLADTCSITNPTVSSLSVNPSSGGSLAFTDGSGVLTVPAGGATSSLIVSHMPLSEPSQPTGALKWAGVSLQLNAVDSNSGPSVTSFSQPLSLSLRYQTPALQAAGIANGQQLGIYSLDLQTNTWQPRPNRAVDTTGQFVTSPLSHFTEFALLADVSPPVSKAVQSPAPNASGWNNSDVAVTITAIDQPPGNGLGVDHTEFNVDGAGWASYTAPVVIATDGIHTIQYRSVDIAGNVEAVQQLAVKIDKAPPVTIAQVTGTAGGGGWFTGPASVTLTVTDNLSGVASTSYSVDGGAAQAYTSPFTISSDGTHNVSFGSTDIARNAEQLKSVTVKIDKTPPVTTATPAAGTLAPGVPLVTVTATAHS